MNTRESFKQLLKIILLKSHRCPRKRCQQRGGEVRRFHRWRRKIRQFGI